MVVFSCVRNFDKMEKRTFRTRFLRAGSKPGCVGSEPDEWESVEVSPIKTSEEAR